MGPLKGSILWDVKILECNHFSYYLRQVNTSFIGSTSVGLPSNWAHMKSDQTMVEVKLSPNDKEYKDVLARFNATNGGSVSISEVRDG